MGKKILIAGESWFSHTIHTKGFDSFTTSVYEEGVKWLREACEDAEYEVIFMPNHVAAEEFPYTMEELQKYEVVVLSDIGANTLLIPQATFSQSTARPNRCDLIRDYVLAGGNLCMIGGYLTFTGIDAKGRWGESTVADVLPVKLSPADDRQEMPQGAAPVIVCREHPIFSGIPQDWPAFLGYNKVKAESGRGEVLATINGDPFVAAGTFGKGKSAVFTSDCSPHWAPPQFCNWEYYKVFWKNLMTWLIKREENS